MKKHFAVFTFLAGLISFAPISRAQNSSPQRLELTGGGETIVLEPYAPNILRVTLSMQDGAAKAAPGYGIVARPDANGWTASESAGADVYKSDRMVVTVNRPRGPAPTKLFGDTGTSKFFRGSAPWANITFTTPDGAPLLHMNGWQQSVYNHKDGNAQLAADRRPSDGPSYVVGAAFASPDDEHYYGLGQNQQGFLDHRGHAVRCWNDYLAAAAPTTCVPFYITNKGYGLLWDNASKTTIEAGFNEKTSWSSESGNRVSYFVIAGNTADEIFAGYKLLTGPTHMLPRAAYGYIQCKQRYQTQDEVLAVARGYR